MTEMLGYRHRNVNFSYTKAIICLDNNYTLKLTCNLETLGCRMGLKVSIEDCSENTLEKWDYSLVRWDYKQVRLDCSSEMLGYMPGMLDYSLVRLGYSSEMLGCMQVKWDYRLENSGYSLVRSDYS